MTNQKLIDDQNEGERIYNLGEAAYYDENNYEEALAYFKQAADLDYKYAFRQVASIYEIELFNVEDAIKWYKKAIEHDDMFAISSYVHLEDDYKALSWLKNKAESGSDLIWYYLGKIYYQGEETEKNLEEAFNCYSKGAEANDANATNMLGEMYDKGEYVAKDFDKAMSLYKKAVSLGSAMAMCNIGDHYRFGIDVTEDKEKALQCYIEANSSVAMDTVGEMYQNGEGIKQDYKEALKWYLKADFTLSDEAIAHIMYLIGTMYMNGEGSVMQDVDKAAEWFKRSANAGNENAIEKLSELI